MPAAEHAAPCAFCASPRFKQAAQGYWDPTGCLAAALHARRLPQVDAAAGTGGTTKDSKEAAGKPQYCIVRPCATPPAALRALCPAREGSRSVRSRRMICRVILARLSL